MLIEANGTSVLSDVVDEHLEEAAFLLEQFERALESPVLRAADLARGVEARLFAHVDGLKSGGPPVFEARLATILAAPDPTNPSATVIASWVAIEAGDFERLWPALDSEDVATTAAVARACELVGNAALDLWLHDAWNVADRAPHRAALLRVMAARRQPPAALIEILQGDDPRLTRAALQAARYADPGKHLPVVEYLLDHEDHEVRRAALLPAILFRSPYAMPAAERVALDPARPHRDAMVLYAAFGGPGQHQNLLVLLGRSTHRRDALFALGFSGNLGVLDALGACLDDADDPLVPKFAAQAMATLTGLDLRDAAFAAPLSRPLDEDARSLPPLEDDDLEGDLDAPPEDALPVPNGDALRAAAAEVARRVPRNTAVLGGLELSSAAVRSFLSRAPLGQRHAAALLEARVGASVGTATRGFVRGSG